MNEPDLTLRVSEVFYSLQGEASRVGLPTVFVRLTGCPLRCIWCDTAHAFTGGETRTLSALVEEISRYQTRHICVTGGEPLGQKHCLALLTRLADDGFDVSLETSGALDISAVDPRVSRIVDLKAPGSGEVSRNRWENIPFLTPRDEIKIIIADRTDYDWARGILTEYRLTENCSVLLSPAQDTQDPTTLAEWILADHLPVRFQLQLHKVLWGNMRGK